MLEQAWQLYIGEKHKMGRYISTGVTQVGTDCCTTYTPCQGVQTVCQKYAYDANQCWQNRIILDSPGSYSFTLPATSSGCMRVVAVGGGGKSKCTNGNCCGFAGAGGGYAEKWDCVVPGTTVSITVGRQESSTTISYNASGCSARTITATGAAGCTPGAGSGGDINSNGGAAGYNCSYCGGSVSHYCGSCLYTYATTCCGYCVVWTGISAHGNLDSGNSASGCCTSKAAGGGSAGSWIWSCGGAGQNAGNMIGCLGNGYGSSQGGGGGIGYITRCGMLGDNCSCMCTYQNGYNGGGWGYPCRKANYPSGSGGGGGTKFQQCTFFESSTFYGQCNSGAWRMGDGGWGGQNPDEGRGEMVMFSCGSFPNGHGLPESHWINAGPQPQCYCWFDIHSMQGSGSSGKGLHGEDALHGNCTWVTTSQYDQTGYQNAGEGAGTGGIGYYCCSLDTLGFGCCISGADACGTVNWQLVCCLGTSGRICCADKMMDALFPYITHCAGTLGGAGGVTVCHLASKAGKGGGAGVTRSYVMCICYGTPYDCCNGSGPLLAFPPQELDWRVSTAGTGMAIIYWKD
jgi:hypothetical protein